jgi:hypothetical protein
MQPPITNQPFIFTSPMRLKDNIHSVIKEMYLLNFYLKKTIITNENIFHWKKWFCKWKRKNQFLKNIWKEEIS